MIRFTWNTPGQPPHSAGLEIDDEGAVVGWQTAGQRVGRFGRSLGAAEREVLAAAVATAAERGPVADEQASGRGATEQVNAEGVGLRLDAGADPPAAAVELVSFLRDLLAGLGDHPVAALELDVSGGPRTPTTASLRHLGDEPLVVRMSGASARTSSFDADSAISDQATVEMEITGDGPIEPGWTHAIDDLVIGSPIKGGFRKVTVDGVEVDVVGDGAARPVELAWMDGDDE